MSRARIGSGLGALILLGFAVVVAVSHSTPPTPSVPRITAPSNAAVVAGTRAQPSPVQDLEGPFQVTRVVDGDTIHVRAGARDVTVRLIGINTPETVAPGRPVECFGPQASAEAHRLLDGRSVYLERDSSQDAVDRYGRTLAYVWISGTDLFNLDMVQGGFAKEYTYRTPYHHRDDFIAAQDAAVAEGAGLWAACQ